MNRDDKKFCDWVRRQACWFGGQVFEKKGYPYFCQQNWNQDLGEYQSELSHIMRKGSTRRDEHVGNVFANCRVHHAWFESQTPRYRARFMEVGQDMIKQYQASKSKVMWDEVRRMQNE